MSSLEQEILERALRWQTNKRPMSQSNNAQYKFWYEKAYKDLINVVMPTLSKKGEKFVEYFICRLFWGRSNERMLLADGTSVLKRLGKFGTGYICITDRSVYFVSLLALTERYPLYEKPKGMFGKALRFAASSYIRDFDEQNPEPQDKLWAIPWESISATHPITIENGTTHIQVVSGKNWEIHPHFNGEDQLILTAINMGIVGKLKAIWMPQTTTDANSKISVPDEVLDMLKKLGELRDTGILTEVEFEQKKKELLSRL